jgi:hypothetical protein
MGAELSTTSMSGSSGESQLAQFKERKLKPVPSLVVVKRPKVIVCISGVLKCKIARSVCCCVISAQLSIFGSIDRRRSVDVYRSVGFYTENWCYFPTTGCEREL